ncbi:hypothetical protein ACQP1O_20135 [Nocardia sp. CA-151230]|uniref:hypothetical protein n=1 Tax=Nocardia sp. CA-151230 TaxID=3239982 RepID=UPI003D90D81D
MIVHDARLRARAVTRRSFELTLSYAGISASRATVYLRIRPSGNGVSRLINRLLWGVHRHREDADRPVASATNVSLAMRTGIDHFAPITE